MVVVVRKMYMIKWVKILKKLIGKMKSKSREKQTRVGKGYLRQMGDACMWVMNHQTSEPQNHRDSQGFVDSATGKNPQNHALSPSKTALLHSKGLVFTIEKPVSVYGPQLFQKEKEKKSVVSGHGS